MSPIIQPDTSQAQDMGPMEPGTYQASVAEVGFQNSKSSGNPMIVPKIKVQYEGKERTRLTYLVIVGEGAFGFDQFLRACGFDAIADQYRDPSQENPPFDTDQLVGQQLQVIIDSDLYQGQKRDKIVGFLKP